MRNKQTSQKTTLCGIEVLLVRDHVKRMNLRVRPDGSVRLSIPYRCSRELAEQFFASRIDWVKAQQELARQTAQAQGTSLTPESIQSDKETLEDKLPEIFGRYETAMGVKCSRWRLRHMVSRWGSCNVKTGVITINTELARLPSACLESVVVHELCHLRVSAHNAEFYALMDTYCPHWRRARQILNANPPRR